MGKKPKALILKAPGTNCEHDSAFAFDLAGAQSKVMHVNQLIETPKSVHDYQIVCIPGGFSYGDDIAAGKAFAAQIQHHLADLLNDFHQQDKLIIGICNGFQVLIKAGLLFEDSQQPEATLSWNDSGRYLDIWVNLNVENNNCIFLRGIKQLELPVAHAEGKFVARKEDVLGKMASKNQLALTYCKPEGPNGAVPYPCNPNGSERNIAGICDPTGRIFGLMPHPERNIEVTHHPNWTRGTTGGAGLAIFENACRYFSA